MAAITTTPAPVATLDEARAIARRTFDSFAGGNFFAVKAVYVMMTFGEVAVDRQGMVMLAADYEAKAGH